MWNGKYVLKKIERTKVQCFPFTSSKGLKISCYRLWDDVYEQNSVEKTFFLFFLSGIFINEAVNLAYSRIYRKNTESCQIFLSCSKVCLSNLVHSCQCSWVQMRKIFFYPCINCL